MLTRQIIEQSWTNPFSADWQDTLIQTRLDTRCLLLLDSAFLPGIYAHLRNASGATSTNCSAVYANLPRCGNAELAVSPVVIEYDKKNAVLSKILGLLDGKPMLTAIWSVETAAELAQRLSVWSIIETENSYFTFRFSDTHRLPAISRVLQPEQIAHMIGPARQWQCINRKGLWEPLSISSGIPVCQDPGRLSMDQFSRLVADSEVDEILAVLEPDFSRVVRACLPSWRHDIATKALRHIQSNEVNERILIVAQALNDHAPCR